jgi:chromate reductase, NAD(P)H dehydrogenase (quinone)
MNFLAIPGSTSARSSTAAILRAAAALAPAGAAVTLFGGLAELPHFNPDLDAEPLPPTVAAFRRDLGAADAVIICSPEYAHGMPGALKNALDWLVSAVEPIGKPVLLICASPTAAPFAHAQLLEVLRTMMGAHLVDGGAHRFSRAALSTAGELTSSELRAALRDGLARLAQACAAAVEPP